jgi:hypothetical protein
MLGEVHSTADRLYATPRSGSSLTTAAMDGFRIPKMKAILPFRPVVGRAHFCTACLHSEFAQLGVASNEAENARWLGEQEEKHEEKLESWHAVPRGAAEGFVSSHGSGLKMPQHFFRFRNFNLGMPYRPGLGKPRIIF